MTTTRQWAADQARAHAAKLREVYASAARPELKELGRVRSETLEAHADLLEAAGLGPPDVLPDVETLSRELLRDVRAAFGTTPVDKETRRRVKAALLEAAARIDRQATALEAASLKSALDHQEVLEREVRELRAALGQDAQETQQALEIYGRLLDELYPGVRATGGVVEHAQSIADEIRARHAAQQREVKRQTALMLGEKAHLREEADLLRRERDAERARADVLEAALAEVRSLATRVALDRGTIVHCTDIAALYEIRSALSALPADLARERDARVRAEALEDAAAQAVSLADGARESRAVVWLACEQMLRARASEIRGGR